MIDMGRPARIFGADRRDPERLSRFSAFAVTVALSVLLWLLTAFALQIIFV
jgi:hypothetical protein